MTTAYYEPGATVDVTIRGARISDRHVQDRRLFVMLPAGGDVHVPLPLPASITVIPSPTGERSIVHPGLAAEVQRLIVDRLHDAHCQVPGCLARFQEETDAAIVVDVLLAAGLLNVAGAHKPTGNNAIVQPEAASPANDRPDGAA